MSKSKVDENTLINHYLTACYFKPKEYFVPLPEYKRITFYRNLIRAIKRDCTACFKKTIVDTLNDHIAYIEKEKNFKKLLTKDQLKQFEELREDIVMWYAMQKEILKLSIGENEIIQMSIQQQEDEKDYELKHKIKDNKYYYYGLEDFNREDECCDDEGPTHYEVNSERKVYYCDDPPVEYGVSKKENKK